MFMVKGYMADEFCDCHEDFCVNLAEYLKQQEKRIDFMGSKSDFASEFAQSIAIPNILKGFREVQKQQLENAISSFGDGYVFNFVNFNYTGTLDSCVEMVESVPGILGKRTWRNTVYDNAIGQVIHVHGSTERDMVLGVNDETQIKALDLFSGYGDEYKNQIIKPKTNEMNEENIDRKVANLILNSHLIYVYGMSMGETDALWWKRIVDRIYNNSSVHLIFRCFSAPEDRLLRRRLETFIRKKKEEFISFSDLDMEPLEKKRVLDQIHIDRNNIFSGLQAVAERAKAQSSDTLAIM